MYYFNHSQAKTHNYNEFDSTPTTYILQSRISDTNLKDFVAKFKLMQKGFCPKEKMPLKHCINNIWLVKPTNLNQGRGIEIFSELDKIMAFVNSKTHGTAFVVQKYIERPLLYKRRKFDIRIWALITTKNEIYFYKQGYLRTSSSQYTLDDANYHIHLTNQCL